MKKMKRALSMLLVSAMILSLFAMTAYADGESTYAGKTGSFENPVTTLDVSKTVQVEKKGVKLPSETFYIQMTPATADELKDKDGNALKSGSVTIEAGLPLAEDIVTLDFDASDSTDNTSRSATENGVFDLTLADGKAFDHSGVYRYYIREVTPVTSNAADAEPTYTAVTNPELTGDAINYITYDTQVYTVDLYVNQESGTDPFVVTSVAVRNANDEKPEAISFTNKIEVGDVYIGKYVDGTEYKKDEAFTFTIMIPVGGDTITLAQDQEIEGKIYNEDHELQETVKIKVNGKADGSDVLEAGQTFTLHDGDYMEISAPLSMIYYVAENDYSDEGYTTTAEYDEDGKFAASTTLSQVGVENPTNIYQLTDGGLCVKGTTNTATSDVIFTNSRHIASDTGINLDVLPYVLALVAAIAAGGACFFFRKRRTVR